MSKKNKKETEGENDNIKYSKRPRFLTWLLLLSILSSFAVNAYLSYDLINRDPENFVTAEEKEESEEDNELREYASELEAAEKERAEEGFITYQPEAKDDNSVKYVKSDKEALALLESLSGELGINDISNYHCTKTDQYTDRTYYCMQQKYNGYDIDGGVITIQTDHYGNLISVNGYNQDIGNFDAEPVFSYSDITSFLKNYLKNHYQLEENQYSLSNYELKIFNIDNKYVLGYRFIVSGHTIIVNAKELSVESDISKYFFANDTNKMVKFDGEQYPELTGQKGPMQPDVFKETDTTCVLKDTERGITIYSPLDSASAEIFGIDYGTGKYDRISFEIQESKSDGASTDPKAQKSYTVKDNPDPSAVDALTNIQKCYDFYDKKFYRKGIRHLEPKYDLPVYIKIDTCGGLFFKSNALMSGTDYIAVGSKITDEEYNPLNDEDKKLFDPTADSASSSEVMAHEYTHGIINDSSTLTDLTTKNDVQKSIQFSISEGLADVFGELVEDYYSDGNGTDWILGDRDAHTEDEKTDARNFIEYTTDCHDGITITSHAAYNMVEGNPDDMKISYDQLAKILYYSVPSFTNKTDFIEFRKLIEQEAVKELSDGNFTDKQLEGIIDSLDKAGINNTYAYDLTEKAKITVYDINDQPYDNFNVKIYKGNQNNVLVSEEDSTKSEYTLPDTICPGIYTIVFTDNSPEVGDPSATRKQISVIINDNSIKNDPVVTYKSNDAVFTKFGSKSNQVVLCVDCSGSMDGTPMNMTKSSAIEFVTKVLELNPSTTVSLVTYSRNASTQITSSSNLNDISAKINKLSASGSTNMYDGMSVSDSIFDYDLNNKKMLVIMSDGLPNEGKGEAQIKSLANDMRDRDVAIFSLGFFHNLNGSDLSSGIALMRSLTAQEFYYNIRTSDELKDTFELLADQISGENYITAEIACPVDVTVTYNGETLSSDPDNYNTKTSFGYLSFEEASEEAADGSEESPKKRKNDDDDDDDEDTGKGDNLKKILRLKAGLDYEISITGTGKGKMNYTISYPNEEGEYKDVRTFSNIPITKDTLISTRTNEKTETVLNIDSDSDGKIDKQYTAVKNKKGKLKEKTDYLPLIRNCLIGLAAFLLVVQTALMISRIRRNGKCSSCKTKIPRKANECPSCGQPRQKISVIFGKKIYRKPQKKGAVIAKLVFTFVFAGITAAGILIYNSAPALVYRHMTEYNYSIAKNLYKREVKNSDLYSKYLNLLTERYLGKVQNGYENSDLNKETTVSICSFITDLKLDDSSDTSKEILEEIYEQEKTTEK